MKLKDKVALVTGSSSGIGRAIALAMAVEGAKVMVNGRNTEALEVAVQEIVRLGGQALAQEANVTDAAQVERMVRATLESFGRIDILVNNAGGVRGIPPTSSIEEVTEEDWDRVLVLNLKSAFLCCRAWSDICGRKGEAGL